MKGADDSDTSGEVVRDSLADALARRIRAMIQSGEYTDGDRLPAILEMARRFGVGSPTVREALKKLETLGVVDVRHGAGVYVASRRGLLVLARPQLGGAVEDSLLVDLVESRIPLEMAVARAAAQQASLQDIDAMWSLLAGVAESVDEHRLVAADAAFHRQLAAAAGNTILAQMLDALWYLFTGEGRVVRWDPLLRDADVQAHSLVLDAIERRDPEAAADSMRAHLSSVRDAVALARGAQRSA